jgi:hypothetical protein
MNTEKMQIALSVLSAVTYNQTPSDSDVILLRSWVKPENKDANPDELAHLVIDERLPPRFPAMELVRAFRMRA